MKKTMLIIAMAIVPMLGFGQIASDDTPSFRFDKIMNIRAMYSDLQCRTNLETNEKVYQIYSRTTNQFDNFCLTIGEIDDAISTIEYFVKFLENSNIGDNKKLKMANGDDLRIEKVKQMGWIMLQMKLSGCAGLAYLDLKVLQRVLERLYSIKTNGA